MILRRDIRRRNLLLPFYDPLRRPERETFTDDTSVSLSTERAEDKSSSVTGRLLIIWTVAGGRCNRRGHDRSVEISVPLPGFELGNSESRTSGTGNTRIFAIVRYIDSRDVGSDWVNSGVSVRGCQTFVRETFFCPPSGFEP